MARVLVIPGDKYPHRLEETDGDLGEFIHRRQQRRVKHGRRQQLFDRFVQLDVTEEFVEEEVAAGGDGDRILQQRRVNQSRRPQLFRRPIRSDVIREDDGDLGTTVHRRQLRRPSPPHWPQRYWRRVQSDVEIVDADGDYGYTIHRRQQRRPLPPHWPQRYWRRVQADRIREDDGDLGTTVHRRQHRRTQHSQRPSLFHRRIQSDIVREDDGDLGTTVHRLQQMRRPPIPHWPHRYWRRFQFDVTEDFVVLDFFATGLAISIRRTWYEDDLDRTWLEARLKRSWNETTLGRGG